MVLGIFSWVNQPNWVWVRQTQNPIRLYFTSHPMSKTHLVCGLLMLSVKFGVLCFQCLFTLPPSARASLSLIGIFMPIKTPLLKIDYYDYVGREQRSWMKISCVLIIRWEHNIQFIPTLSYSFRLGLLLLLRRLLRRWTRSTSEATNWKLYSGFHQNGKWLFLN